MTNNHVEEVTGRVIEVAPRFFATTELSKADWLQKHANAQGTKLRERAMAPLSTSALDTPVFRRLLAHMLRDVPRSGLVVELGAGDGRITHELLALGFENILAVEGNMAALHRLYDSLSAEQRARVRLLCSDILTLQWQAACADALVSIEVLCCLNEHFENVLSRLRDAVKPGGLLVHSELMQEGNLLYALALQDEEHIRNTLEKRFMTIYGPARLFTLEELEYIHSSTGLAVIEMERLPISHGFISAAARRLDSPSEELMLRAQSALCGHAPARAMLFALRIAERVVS